MTEYTSLEKKEALQEIYKLVNQAQGLIDQAVAIADEYGVGFDVNIGGYGMGGWYDPHDHTDQWGNDNQGWHASSQSC